MWFFLTIAMAGMWHVCAAQHIDDHHEDNAKYVMAAWLIEVNQIASNYINYLDEKKYSVCWLACDPLFQQAVSQQEWSKALDCCRYKFGNVVSRTLQQAMPYENPHGLPEGNYIIITYRTTFEKNNQCQEVLTIRRALNGDWNVLSYHIR